MRLSLTCPICDEQIIIKILDNQIISVQVGDSNYTSLENIKLLLEQRDIEIG